MSKLKKLVIFLSILVIALPVSTFAYFYHKLDSIYDGEIDTGIVSSKEYVSEKGITNVLLVGTDARPGEENSRSDAMMILTVDTKNKSLKLTSLARDSYVEVPGYGKTKLTHAMAYGGINLLVATIEENFEVDIQNYAVVNFYSFMDIVDVLGGVTVDVKSKEVSEVNKFIDETYDWCDNPNKGTKKYLKSSGVQTLNGYQALSYSRIRKIDSTSERDRRQRDVIQSLIDGVKDLPITKYNSLIDTILPYVSTNMKPTQILSLGTKLLSIGNLDIKQLEFPIDDGVNSTGGKIGGVWYLQFDPDSLEILHNFIFEDIIPDEN